MKSIWLIMGGRQTGKSHLVRCLLETDDPDSEADVFIESGLKMHIRGNAETPQARGLTPDAWLAQLESTRYWHGGLQGVRNVIATLRYDAQIDSGPVCPPGEEYVDRLISAGWTIQVILSLGETARSWVQWSGVPFLSLPESRSCPIHQTTSAVRKTLGWAHLSRIG